MPRHAEQTGFGVQGSFDLFQVVDVGGSAVPGNDVPALVAVGTKDTVAGEPQALAELFPQGEALDIPGRDHMVAVGDKVFKTAAIRFLNARV